MQTITIQVPDDFNDDQIEFIKNSAFNQIKAEIEAKGLVVAEDVKALVATKVKAVSDAMAVDNKEVV